MGRGNLGPHEFLGVTPPDHADDETGRLVQIVEGLDAGMRKDMIVERQERLGVSQEALPRGCLEQTGMQIGSSAAHQGEGFLEGRHPDEFDRAAGFATPLAPQFRKQPLGLTLGVLEFERGDSRVVDNFKGVLGA